MVGTIFAPHVTWWWRIPSKKKKKSRRRAVIVSCSRGHNSLCEGPSCIFVGPLESASIEVLEALYRQARDAYYSGDPLIVDDMFDKVELKLRSYGSKSVVKYPRCSLMRQSTYADAEEDPAQVLALASVWTFLLMLSSLALLIPVVYTIGLAYQDAFGSRLFSNSARSAVDFIAVVNLTLFMGLGSLIGYPIASASVRALEGLWRSDLVALKGSCPNCGEEVFAFIVSYRQNNQVNLVTGQIAMCASALWNSALRWSNQFQDRAGTGFMDVFTLFQALLRSVKDGHRVNGVLLTQYDLEAVVWLHFFLSFSVLYIWKRTCHKSCITSYWVGFKISFDLNDSLFPRLCIKR